MRPGKRRTLDMGEEIDLLRDQLETVKARIRAKVEHPFHPSSTVKRASD